MLLICFQELPYRQKVPTSWAQMGTVWQYRSNIERHSLVEVYRLSLHILLRVGALLFFLSPRLRRGYCYRLRQSVRYAISSQTAGQNPTKFDEWLAYTSGACKSMFIFGPAPRGPGEGSKGQILTSVGICDGVPSTARSSFAFLLIKNSRVRCLKQGRLG